MKPHIQLQIEFRGERGSQVVNCFGFIIQEVLDKHGEVVPMINCSATSGRQFIFPVSCLTSGMIVITEKKGGNSA